MSTTSTGRAAEQQAADYLTAHGYVILDRNWHNRWCELDIVARKDGTVQFVEVKYRATTNFGHPSEYINYDKITRLSRAALAWSQARGYHGAYQIDVISVTGVLTHSRVEHLPNVISS